MQNQYLIIPSEIAVRLVYPSWYQAIYKNCYGVTCWGYGRTIAEAIKELEKNIIKK